MCTLGWRDSNGLSSSTESISANISANTIVPHGRLRLGHQEEGVSDGPLEPKHAAGEGEEVDGVQVPVDETVLSTHGAIQMPTINLLVVLI